ncbi:unnamed protein product [Anisakis simplex]|uniref:Vesicular, overexpressed in cancer, prosurvival protein 1 n=1 Tax=Anisakis simplex TaxID=6269 RepID=A0A0M3K7Z8_ANISI|nr:unnamed protein product [Anisakis simplex]
MLHPFVFPFVLFLLMAAGLIFFCTTCMILCVAYGRYHERRYYHSGPIATVHPVPFVTPGSAYPAYPPPPPNPSLYEASQSSSAVISSQPTINQPNANASICAEQFIANTDTSPPPPYCSVVNPPKSSS